MKKLIVLALLPALLVISGCIKTKLSICELTGKSIEPSLVVGSFKILDSTFAGESIKKEAHLTPPKEVIISHVSNNNYKFITKSKNRGFEEVSNLKICRVNGKIFAEEVFNIRNEISYAPSILVKEKGKTYFGKAGISGRNIPYLKEKYPALKEDFEKSLTENKKDGDRHFTEVDLSNKSTRSKKIKAIQGILAEYKALGIVFVMEPQANEKE